MGSNAQSNDSFYTIMQVHVLYAVCRNILF